MNQLTIKSLGSLLMAGVLLQSAVSLGQQTSDPVSSAPNQQSGQQSGQQPSQVTKPELPNGPSPSPASTDNVPATTQPPPSGTAAAPEVEMSGNPVSRPAGAAIAPPKQHRVRSLLIKMGFIAGAGVAVGTVAALTLSSPARVPGSPGSR